MNILAKEAERILGSPDDLKKVLTESLANAKDTRLLSVMGRGTLPLSYLTSSRVPVSKRLGIVAAMLYLLSPITFPGPVDEVLVLAWLLPFLNKELDAFETGRYEDSALDTGVVSRTGNPILDLFAEEDPIGSGDPGVKSNPLLNL